MDRWISKFIRVDVWRGGTPASIESIDLWTREVRARRETIHSEWVRNTVRILGTNEPLVRARRRCIDGRESRW